MDAYVMEGIKSILVAMVVIGILLAVVYLFWRYKDKIIKSLFPEAKKRGNFNHNPIFPKKTGDNPICLLYTSPSPRDLSTSRMPSSA